MSDAPGAPGAPPAISDEDAKLVVLARAAKARVGAPEGAAVRDTSGRTYVAATVSLRTLRLTAVQAAAAAALSSGADALEAAAVVGEHDHPDEPVLTELQCPIWLLATPDGSVTSIRHPAPVGLV